MILRRYESTDCEVLAQLFYDTVHAVNAGDYTPAQLDAWATGQTDTAAWNRRFLSTYTLVAIESGRIVGFGNIDEEGYLDMLYVHRGFQCCGVATALCDALESSVTKSMYTTYASITARPFFEARGYRVVREQQVERRGESLTNFVMEKAENESGSFVPAR